MCERSHTQMIHILWTTEQIIRIPDKTDNTSDDRVDTRTSEYYNYTSIHSDAGCAILHIAPVIYNT
jgi:hypothetical protein